MLNYFSPDEQVRLSIKNYEILIQEIVINAYFVCGDYETLNFILENPGISIPFKYFFVKKNISTYGIRFKTRENQKDIKSWKDLI